MYTTVLSDPFEVVNESLGHLLYEGIFIGLMNLLDLTTVYFRGKDEFPSRRWSIFLQRNDTSVNMYQITDCDPFTIL